MKIAPVAAVLFTLAFTVTGFTCAGLGPIAGTVECISESSVTLQTARGVPTSVTILLLPSTKLLEDGVEVSRQELKIGTQVVVSAKARTNKLEAHSVIIERQPAHGETGGSFPRPAPRYSARGYSGGDLRLESRPETPPRHSEMT